ncbi:hypothetical protein JTB14_032664 [Gonioctena quinquepunctata]|nr:hypothetical protein JTB14_032664 [Gonioctena quinquepunctata]
MAKRDVGNGETGCCEWRKKPVENDTKAVENAKTLSRTAKRVEIKWLKVLLRMTKRDVGNGEKGCREWRKGMLGMAKWYVVNGDKRLLRTTGSNTDWTIIYTNEENLKFVL